MYTIGKMFRAFPLMLILLVPIHLIAGQKGSDALPGSLDEWLGYQVEFQNSIAYFMTDDAKLHIVDLSEDAPSILAVRDLQVTPGCSDLRDGLLAVSGVSDGVELIDVSTPDSPTQIALISQINDDYPDLSPGRISLSDGNRLMIASNDDVFMFDISTPSSPVFAGAITADHSVRGVGAHTSVLSIAQRSFGMQTFNISDPSNPYSLGSASVRSDIIIHNGYRVYILGAEFEAAVFRIYTIEDPTTPTELGSHSTYAGYDGEFTLPALAVSEEQDAAFMPYVWEQGEGNVSYGFFVYSIDDPEATDRIANIQTDTTPYDGQVDGNRFLLSSADGYHLYDITDPASPQLLGNYTLGIEETYGRANLMPETIRIESIYPNPFNSSTTIQVSLAQPSTVRLELFNMLGQKVAVLHNGNLPAGKHAYSLQTATLGSGLYLIRAETDLGGSHTRKTMLVR